MAMSMALVVMWTRLSAAIRHCGLRSTPVPKSLSSNTNMSSPFEIVAKRCGGIPPFIEAALLRATANAHLGRYAEALKEINHCISIHPRSDALGRALSDRA